MGMVKVFDIKPPDYGQEVKYMFYSFLSFIKALMKSKTQRSHTFKFK